MEAMFNFIPAPIAFVLMFIGFAALPLVPSGWATNSTSSSGRWSS